MSIGERIKAIRKDYGLTQEEFGKRISLVASTISVYNLCFLLTSLNSTIDPSATFSYIYLIFCQSLSVLSISIYQYNQIIERDLIIPGDII